MHAAYKQDKCANSCLYVLGVNYDKGNLYFIGVNLTCTNQCQRTRHYKSHRRSFAADLAQPYCGANTGTEAVRWMPANEGDSAPIASLALVPLRRSSADPVFGLLALGSPDPTRYSADMATDFLARLGEVAGAALSRLLPASA